MWTLYSCSLVDGLILQCLTCSVPPQVVFTRYVTEARCTLSMVDEKLLIMGCGFRPRGHPDVRMDGERVIGLGDYLQLSKKKQGLKYRNLPLHQSILTEVSTFPLFILRVKLSTPSIHTKQCLYNYFTVQCLQYNICSTISVVQYLLYNFCSTISAVQLFHSLPLIWVTQY